MPHVRSVTVGVWLTRGSRHESDQESGVAHFVEHMLFKGTTTRSARDIAQTIDSIGGQLDAFTAKEYAGYYIKVLDEHLPLALDLLSDMISVRRSRWRHRRRSRASSSKRSRWSRTRPTTSSTRCLRSSSGRSIHSGDRFSARPRPSARSTSDGLRSTSTRTYVAPNLIVAAAGHLEHERFRDLVGRAFADLGSKCAWSARKLRRLHRAWWRDRRTSSKTTCASAAARIRRLMRTATRCTCSTRSWAGR